MDERAYGEAVKTFARGFGLRILDSVAGRLDPELLLQQAEEAFRVEFRETLLQIFSDAESAPIRELSDRFYKELPEEIIIDAIAKPLAEDLALWFKENSENLLAALVEAILREWDLDSLQETVADRVANRVQITPD